MQIEITCNSVKLISPQYVLLAQTYGTCFVLPVNNGPTVMLCDRPVDLFEDEYGRVTSRSLHEATIKPHNTLSTIINVNLSCRKNGSVQR